MPLGKTRSGRTVGPSSAQRGENARNAAAKGPLVEVTGTGYLDPENPHRDVDALACGHFLSGATDLVGRRYPGRRRCWKCKASDDGNGDTP